MHIVRQLDFRLLALRDGVQVVEGHAELMS